MEAVVKYLVLPSSVMTISALLSLALAGFRPARKWAWGLGLLALLMYAIFGAGPVSYLLLGSLEFRVPPADRAELSEAGPIVVLAGYAEADRDYPLSSQVNSTSAIRLLEALIRDFYYSVPRSVQSPQPIFGILSQCFIPLIRNMAPVGLGEFFTPNVMWIGQHCFQIKKQDPLTSRRISDPTIGFDNVHVDVILVA